MAARKSRSKAKAARPTTVAAYLASLTPEKRAVIEEARAFVHRHIPKGYAEFMNWGVINWGIPLEEFSNTHNGQPLCYVGLGAQKSYNSLYLMGAYDSSPASTHRRSPRSCSSTHSRKPGSGSTWGSAVSTSRSSMISSSPPSRR